MIESENSSLSGFRAERKLGGAKVDGAGNASCLLDTRNSRLQL